MPPIPGPRDLRAVAGRGADLLDQLVAAVPRASAVLTAAETLVSRAAALLTEVEELLDRVEGTRANADVVVGRADETRARADAVMTSLQKPLPRLLPTLERLADTTSPAEVEAAVALVDTLPRLVTRLEQDVLPMLDGLSSVAPDVRALLEASRELNEMLARLPGMGRIKKRVEEED